MKNDPYNTEPEARKYHFWRGFRSACIVLVPFVLVLMFISYRLLDLLIK